MQHRLVIALALGALLLFAPSSFAQDTLTGAWDLTINGPQGTVNAGAEFKKDGDEVTGTMDGPQGQVSFTGTMTGSTVKVSFDIDTPQGSINIIMTGDVDGTSMKGTMDFGMGTADFTGKKK